jgi:archaemetzincin
MPDPVPDRILISPIGNFPDELLDPMARMVRKVFGFETHIQPVLGDIKFAWDTNRQQYHSTPILERLAVETPPGTLKVAALCREDLFIPILTYVFGEAQLGGQACIVSSYRLENGLTGTQSKEAFISRMAKEIVHELGHTFNLRHCPDPVCLMHYCRNESDVDRKSDQFCRYCKVLLEDALEKL